MHEALDDPKVTKVVAMKSAQVAWTDGVLLNYIGKRIDVDPCPMIVMFAKDKAAAEFSAEKLVPMIEVSPRLLEKVPVHRSRDKDNKTDFKSFPGGFLKLVGSNSPSSVKSTPAPVVAVEEPDDCNDNVKEQGDTITLLEERTKTFPRRKVIFGGTPTIEDVSRVESAYKASDQRKFFVPCHACGESHVLTWENVRWLIDAAEPHEVFGRSRPDSARYACPSCGVLWTDAEKNRNVRQGRWEATAAFHGVAGFYMNELYSPFPGSLLVRLVEKYLTAQKQLEAGDDTKMRAFRNSTEGLPYAYKSDLPAEDKLRERSLPYAEFTVPMGGLLLTAGVDVQHDRIAVVIRAWGRGEESWLVCWMEIPGQTMVRDQGAWPALDELLGRSFRHESGGSLRIRAVSIDSSDGQTSDAVYGFVRSRLARGFMAVKGGSDEGREIFSAPRPSVDVNREQKAHKYGLKVYMVGVQRAKDLILGSDPGAGRLKLTGEGPGRMHWYSSVRPDYFEHLLSEVKVPHKTVKNRKVWTKRAGKRNEGLDCEVYALHAARSLKVNLWRESIWVSIETALRQAVLLEEPLLAPAVEGGGGHSAQVEASDAGAAAPELAEAVEAPAVQTPAPAPKPARRPSPARRPGGFATNW